jgi:hypothetical protein
MKKWSKERKRQEGRDIDRMNMKNEERKGEGRMKKGRKKIIEEGIKVSLCRYEEQCVY